jgi:hypothetical protein
LNSLTIALEYFDHNDFLYLASASRTGDLYSDINFVQAPLSYWFWRGVYIISPHGYAYIIFQMVSLLLTIFSILIFSGMFKYREQKTIFIILASVSFYALRAGFEIGSYSLPAFFTSAAIFFLLKPGQARLIAPLFLGLAASAKLSFLVFIVPGFFIYFIGQKDINRRYIDLLFWLAIYALGLLPIAWYFLSNPSAFIFHNLTFHSEITYASRGMTPVKSALSIIGGFGKFFVEMALMLSVIVVGIFEFIRSKADLRGALSDAECRRPKIFLLMLLLFFLFSVLAAISPKIIFVQYLSYTAVIVIGIAAFFYNLISKGLTPVIFLLIYSYALMTGVPDTLYRGVKIITNGSPVIEHSRASSQLSEIFNNFEESNGSQCERSVFTLSGSIVADTTLPLTKFTEGGSFWVGKGEFIPAGIDKSSVNFFEELSDPMRHISAGNIEFVLVGYYIESSKSAGEFERSFVTSSSDLGYEKIHAFGFDERQMSLYRKSNCGQ